MKRTLSILFVLALVLSFSLVATTPVAAQSWLSGWSYRVEITVHSGEIDAALTDFPVLLYLSTSSGLVPTDVSFIFDEVGANGKKIAVTTSDGTTQCYVEIEKWDSANEQAWLWVKVPSIASGADTVLYLYYDSSKADNTAYVGDTGSTPAQNVWDSNFKGVWHKDDADDSSGAVRDSTSNEYHGTKKGAGEPANVDGRIGRAQDYDGVDDYVEVAWDAITGTQARTVTFWIKPGADGLASGESHFVDWGPNNPGERYSIRLYDVGGNNVLRVQVENGYKYGTTALNQGQWYHAAVVFPHDSTDVVDHLLYVNGQLEAVGAESSRLMNTVDTVLRFARSVGWPSRYGKGSLDEVRISDVGRSAAWIKATYVTGSDSLLSYGSEQSAAGCISTYTSTGTACFTPSHGAIVDLQAVPAVSPAPRGVSFPHGMFEFRVTGLAEGATVTLTIELPQPVPDGFVWWKHDDTRWHSLPIGRTADPKVITLTLTDGVFPGDMDEEADGTITDPGGPGNPVPPLTVGWEGSSVSKAAVVAPWIALLAAMMAGATLLVVRRRRAQI